MNKTEEKLDLGANCSQSTSSESLIGIINTGFDDCSKDDINENIVPCYSKVSCSKNEDSILNKINTGFGCDKTLTKDCKKPVYKTHLCKESYLGEFESETEKSLARNNLNVYSKNETHLIIQKSISNVVTKNDLEETIKDLDYTTSRLKTYVNYIIPENLFN